MDNDDKKTNDQLTDFSYPTVSTPSGDVTATDDNIPPNADGSGSITSISDTMNSASHPSQTPAIDPNQAVDSSKQKPADLESQLSNLSGIGTPTEAPAKDKQKNDQLKDLSQMKAKDSTSDSRDEKATAPTTLGDGKVDKGGEEEKKSPLKALASKLTTMKDDFVEPTDKAENVDSFEKDVTKEVDTPKERKPSDTPAATATLPEGTAKPQTKEPAKDLSPAKPKADVSVMFGDTVPEKKVSTPPPATDPKGSADQVKDKVTPIDNKEPMSPPPPMQSPPAKSTPDPMGLNIKDQPVVQVDPDKANEMKSSAEDTSTNKSNQPSPTPVAPNSTTPAPAPNAPTPTPPPTPNPTPVQNKTVPAQPDNMATKPQTNTGQMGAANPASPPQEAPNAPAQPKAQPPKEAPNAPAQPKAPPPKEAPKAPAQPKVPPPPPPAYTPPPQPVVDKVNPVSENITPDLASAGPEKKSQYIKKEPEGKKVSHSRYPYTIEQLLDIVVERDASDLHITVDYPAMIRVDGALVNVVEELVTPQQAQDLILPVLPEQKKELLDVNREVDLAHPHRADARFRINAYYQKQTVAAAFRLIPNTIRNIDELNLPQIYHRLTNLKQGLVLVTGPTGSGKSTTLAAILQEINETRPDHIITIEDPVEYVFPRAKAMVDQRELHEDTHSWEIALRSALRQDPDVILVGEMRDYDTISSAITLAETGHLVFATLHTNSAAQTLDRIVDVFPEHQQAQVRSQLSNTIEAVIAQRLIPLQRGGRMAVSEIMIATPAIRNLIREAKTHQIDNVIRTSADIGMISLEHTLVKMVRENTITMERAMEYAVHPEEIVRLLKS